MYILFVMREKKNIDNLVPLATVEIKFTNNRYTIPWGCPMRIMRRKMKFNLDAS